MCSIYDQVLTNCHFYDYNYQKIESKIFELDLLFLRTILVITVNKYSSSYPLWIVLNHSWLF